MNIVMYFINWNDIDYLPFIAGHYGSFCSKIIMYDNYSTDGSQNLAKKLGFEVREFGKRGELNDQFYLDVKNHCWKEQRNKGVDYVIVCDADEFVVVPELITCSLPKVQGWNMVSDEMPVKSVFEIKTGAESESYSKRAIFNPDAIKEINYIHGCHVCKPVGHITENDTCDLYHYRQVGGVDRMIERHKAYVKRMSQFNKKYKMGVHYLHDEQAKKNEFEQLKKESRIVL